MEECLKLKFRMVGGQNDIAKIHCNIDMLGEISQTNIRGKEDSVMVSLTNLTQT